MRFLRRYAAWAEEFATVEKGLPVSDILKTCLLRSIITSIWHRWCEPEVNQLGLTLHAWTFSTCFTYI